MKLIKDNIPSPVLHSVKSANISRPQTPEIPPGPVSPIQPQFVEYNAPQQLEAQIASGVPTQPVVLGERPVVQEITARVYMTKLTANQIFPHLIFGPDEDHVVITEIMRPAAQGDLVACVHGASGQRFAISHYELNGKRI